MQNKKWVSILLAFVVSIGLWLYVVTVENPTKNLTISNVPVSFTNVDVLRENGFLITDSNVVDGVDLKFTDDAITEIARIAEDMNTTSEDIGARRLHTVMENLIEDISFDADGTAKEIVIDSAYVIEKLGGETKEKDLKKYIL